MDNKKLFLEVIVLLTLATSIISNATTCETVITKGVSESVFDSVVYLATETYNTPIEPTTIIEAEPAKPEYSESDIELLALVTMAEAEGESEEGTRLVIDTILNRVDHSYFPDTIYGVVYQSGQFTSMWNGRVNRCYVRGDIRKLVEEELASRTNTDVIYFTAGRYGKYGTPLFQVGNHYFASY